MSTKSKTGDRESLKKKGNVVFLAGANGVLKNFAGGSKGNHHFDVFKYAFDSNRDAIAIFGLEGTVYFVNNSFLAVFGYDREDELKGMKVADLFAPEEAGAIQGLLKSSVPGVQLMRPDSSARAKGGKAVPVSVYAFMIFNENKENIGLLCSIRDISERKQSEQTLQKYRLIIENIKDVIYTTDPRGNITFISPNVYDWAGYKSEEIIGRNILEFVAPGDAQEAAKNLQQSIETKAESKSLVRLLKKNGEVVDAELFGKFVCDENKNLVQFNGVIRDITERIKSEEALKKSEANLKAVFNSSLQGILLLDQDMNIQFANKVAEEKSKRLLKLPTCEGLNLLELAGKYATEKNLNWLKANFQKALGGKIVRDEQPGLGYWWTINFEPVFKDEQVTSVCLSVLDITERKRGEEALRKSEERSRFALDVIETGYWDLNLIDHTAQRSLRHDQIFGYETMLPQWTFEMFLEHVVPEDRGAVNQKFQQAIESKGDWNFECRIIRRDGEQRWILAKGRHRLDSRGQPQLMGGIVQDITARKRAEEALKKSETLLNETGRMAKVGGWEFDVNTMEQVWTEEVSRIHEVDKSYQPTVSKGIDFYTPESRPVIERAVQRAIEHGEPFDVELEIITAKGNLRGIHAIGKPDREHHKIFGVFQDITDRKQAEEEIARSEARFRSLVQNSSDAVTILNQEAKIIYASTSAERILGYRAEEMMGRQAMDFIHPEDRALIGKAIMELMSNPGSFLTVEYRFLQNDGSYLWLESTGTNFLGDPQIAGLVVNSRDITERKRIENELRCHAEEIKDLYNNAPCGYHSLDKDGTFIQINDTLLNWLGYSRDEIIGKKKLGDLLTRDEIQKFQRNFPVLKKEGKLRNLECEFVRKDGSILPLLLNSTAVKDSSGGYISNRSSTFDISERKIMEEMLLKSEARFRALVQNSSDVFMILEADGTYRYVNLSSERIMGYKPEELIGKKPMDFVHPDDLEKFLQAFGKCVRIPGYTCIVQYRFLKPDGTFIWLESVGANSLNDINIKGIVINARDITERKRADERLELRNIILSTQQETSLDGILVVGEDGKIMSFNRRFVELWEIPDEVLESKSDERAVKSVLDKLAEPELFAQRIKYLYDHNSESSQEEIALKDGRTFERYSSPMRGNEGRYYGRVWYFRDITERNNMLKALRESEARYQALYDRSMDMVYLADFSGQFIDANAVALKAFGYEREDIPNLNFASLLTPGQIPVVLQAIKEVQETGTQKGLITYKIKIKNGEERYIESLASAVYRDGKPVAMQGIARDITARLRAEQAMRESENRFRGLFESSRDALMTIESPSWTFTSGNMATLEMFRVKNEEKFSSLGPWDLSPEKQPDGRASDEKAREMIETAMRKGSHFFEWTHKRGTGEDFPAHVLLTRMEQAGKQFILATVRDITELKRAEQEVRESEEKYRLLAEHTSDTIWTMDFKNLRFTYVSPANKALTGYTPEEEMQLSLEKVLTPDSLKKVAIILEEESNNEKLPSRNLNRARIIEIEQYRKDGSIVSVECQVTFIRDRNNEPSHLLGISRDISERKAAEKEKQKLLASLVQSEKLLSLGQFAGGMAHEINNPIAYIKANLNVLDEYRKNINDIFHAYQLFDDDTNGKRASVKLSPKPMVPDLKSKLNMTEIMQDYKDIIFECQEGVDRIRNIIQSLKKFSEPPKNLPELADLNVIIENILPMVKSEIMRKATLRKELGELPKIKCYPEELGQVFMNLISNALNAIDKHGEIKISTEMADGVVRVKVSDNGVGITPEQMTRIFDPFYTTQDQAKAKGLGLSVSYGIIKKHGGEIKVESEPGKGSTFIVELPAKN